MKAYEVLFEVTGDSIKGSLLDLAILVEDSTLVGECQKDGAFYTNTYSVLPFETTKKYELFPKGGVAAHHLVERANKLNGKAVKPDTVCLSFELIEGVLYVVTPDLDTYHLGEIDDVDAACNGLKQHLEALFEFV